MTTPAPASSGPGSKERPCVHCKTLLPAQARFYGVWGAPQTPAPTPTSPNPEHPERIRWKAWR